MRTPLVTGNKCCHSESNVGSNFAGNFWARQIVDEDFPCSRAPKLNFIATDKPNFNYFLSFAFLLWWLVKIVLKIGFWNDRRRNRQGAFSKAETSWKILARSRSVPISCLLQGTTNCPELPDFWFRTRQKNKKKTVVTVLFHLHGSFRFLSFLGFWHSTYEVPTRHQTTAVHKQRSSTLSWPSRRPLVTCSWKTSPRSAISGLRKIDVTLPRPSDSKLADILCLKTDGCIIRYKVSNTKEYKTSNSGNSTKVYAISFVLFSLFCIRGN